MLFKPYWLVSLETFFLLSPLIHTYIHTCTHTHIYIDINIVKWGHPCGAARFRMRIVHGSYFTFVETQKSPHCHRLVCVMEVTLLLLPMKFSLSEQVGRHPYCGMLVKFSSKALLGGREKGTSCLSGGSGGNGSDTVWRGEGCDKTVVMSARLLCFFSSLQ